MQIQPRNTVLLGDAHDQLSRLPSAWVDSVISSPPFYLLRDYGVDGQIGLEASVEQWVEALRPVFSEVARVLKPSGSMWLDLGDSYSRHLRFGAPTKSLLLAPERLLLALATDGWIIRNRIVWAKTTPMPSGVTDRLDTTHDLIYFLVRSQRYFFDLDAARPRLAGGLLGRNPGEVWNLPTASFAASHFATFPEQLVDRPLLATCPARVCLRCGAPWRIHTTIERVGKRVRFKRDPYVRRHPVRYRVLRRNPRLRPGCGCRLGIVPGLVLDPFLGSGTVAAVAERHGRDWLGIELSPDYAEMAWRRIRGVSVRRAA